ncbi:MAG TPA: ATP-binding protein [Actinoplanes sp.]
MRVLRGLRAWWRPAVVPLKMWLLLVMVGTGLLAWQQNHSRQAVVDRYVSGVRVLSQFMSSIAADQLLRERVQAQMALADPVVATRDFADRARGGRRHHISAGTPVSVIAPDETTGLADPAQLQLILGNLLTNATKYGSPPIEVTVLNAGEQVAIRVADHGEGVPPEFVPHLFDRFARADSGVATTTAGTGLGLYLVRQLAQAGGLDVGYEPHQPRGAVFTLTVPRASPVARPLATSATSPARGTEPT